MRHPLRNLPIVDQLTRYNRQKCVSDGIAALVVTVMLIPQSLAYALLAGLPPHYGLYASIVPIVIYSLLGSSSTLAVGPVAIASIMTATSLSAVTAAGLVSYVDGAITLALLSGAMLLLLGIFKFGFVANFLSHSVVSGFITASSLIIAVSQCRHLIGVSATGHNFFDLTYQLLAALPSANPYTLTIGLSTLLYLILARRFAKPLLMKLGVPAQAAASLSRMSPILAVCVSIGVVLTAALENQGVAVVGAIPTGIADPTLPRVSWQAVQALMVPSFFIAIIGYVESISVGRTLGAKRGERVNPDQELIALGGANIASGAMGAFPISGGFSRSVVNFDAGAQTQLAGIYTAIGIALASLLLTPYLYALPIAMLAATIIVAVLSLTDFSLLTHAWKVSKSDFVAAALTILVTLSAGVEAGVGAGIISSILLHLYHTSHPHIAEIGRIPNTDHFRNVKYYRVEQLPNTLSLRIDESLLFSNASYLETHVMERVAQRPAIANVILHCGAVNTIDLTALEMLHALNQRLFEQDIRLHLSEVKVPVKIVLEKDQLLSQLSGELFLSHVQAHQSMANHG